MDFCGEWPRLPIKSKVRGTRIVVYFSNYGLKVGSSHDILVVAKRTATAAETSPRPD
jgi:hypothetical protein